jgi:hypothetical protein
LARLKGLISTASARRRTTNRYTSAIERRTAMQSWPLPVRHFEQAGQGPRCMDIGLVDGRNRFADRFSLCSSANISPEASAILEIVLTAAWSSISGVGQLRATASGADWNGRRRHET